MQFQIGRRDKMVLELTDKIGVLNLSSREFIEVRPVIFKKNNDLEERKQQKETKKMINAINESAKKIASSD